MGRVANRDNNKGKVRAASKAVSRVAMLRADPWEAPAQDSVMEPTVEAFATRIPAADVPAACTTILIPEITRRAEVPRFSPIILRCLRSALTMTACAI